MLLSTQKQMKPSAARSRLGGSSSLWPNTSPANKDVFDHCAGRSSAAGQRGYRRLQPGRPTRRYSGDHVFGWAETPLSRFCKRARRPSTPAPPSGGVGNRLLLLDQACIDLNRRGDFHSVPSGRNGHARRIVQPQRYGRGLGVGR